MVNVITRLKAYPQRFWGSLSYIGLIIATFFFAASLSPSLLPRHFIVQGVLSGIALAIGYGLGILGKLLWNFLEFPQIPARVEKPVRLSITLSALAVAGLFLWRATIWQNSVRDLMEMDPVETAYPFRVALIAALTGVVLLLAGSSLIGLWRWINYRISRYLPRRVSYLITTFILVFGLLTVANKVFFRLAIDVADQVFVKLDQVINEGIEQPESELASGGPDSLIEWETIGRWGKAFVAAGPTQESISAFSGTTAMQPIRVYVGLGSRETMQERADLALQELIRVGGFERSVLVVATPTGTGWLDPGAVDTVEYLHDGDIATVSMQYSYLPSWITILVDPNRSRHSARFLFTAIYDHWKTLPKDARPRLYVHGLSLGSLGSESSVDLFTIFEDPIHGGVWSGPPFPSTQWNKATHYRNPGSPMWLPTFRDGSLLRFTARENAIDDFGSRWGPMRFVYIQHASDPMVFFSPSLLYSSPGWLENPRGDDVSPYLSWYPIITFLQVAFDLPMATSIPIGYGHNYAPDSYIDAWVAVTNPKDWNDEKTAKLKAQFQHYEAERSSLSP